MKDFELGKRLKEIRKLRNMTQGKLASSINTSAGYISEVESGKKVPGSNFLISLKRVYGVNPTWLLIGEGEMFKSDSDTKNKDIGMNSEFIERLRKDLKDKDDSFYASLSMSKEKILDVILEKEKLSRIEVIELSRKLNRSLDEYIYLAGYVPEEFKRVLKNPRMLESLRTAGKLTDKDIDQAITAFANVLKEFEKRHNLDKS